MPHSEILIELYDPLVERVGFILKSGEVIEVQNICEKPEEGFDVSGEDIAKYGLDAIATWHTHPNASNNLSMNDHEMFLNWPELSHYIVGTNGVRCYVVEDGEVLIDA